MVEFEVAFHLVRYWEDCVWASQGQDKNKILKLFNALVSFSTVGVESQVYYEWNHEWRWWAMELSFAPHDAMV